MRVMWTNKDVADAAESAGMVIKQALPKTIDKKLMIDMLDDACVKFVIESQEEYEMTREVMQEISNRFIHNLLEAADKTVEYYKTVAESTEGSENE